jgi:hypothetical protein
LFLELLESPAFADAEDFLEAAELRCHLPRVSELPSETVNRDGRS